MHSAIFIVPPKQMARRMDAWAKIVDIAGKLLPWCSCSHASISRIPEGSWACPNAYAVFQSWITIGLSVVYHMTISTVGDKLTSNWQQKAPLPRYDFNTRIVLFGRDSAQACTLADEFSKIPWHNVTYFSGTFETLRTTIK
jgi:hypothetical protein